MKTPVLVDKVAAETVEMWDKRQTELGTPLAQYEIEELTALLKMQLTKFQNIETTLYRNMDK